MILLQHWSASFKKYRRHGIQRPRTNFLWYMSADALLSIFLIIGLFQWVGVPNHDHLNRLDLEHAGAVSLSASQIIEQIRHEGKRAYWLGPEQGSRYATVDIVPHELTITYIPRGSDLYAPDQPKMTVQTFDNLESFQDIEHIYLDSETTEHLLTKSGNTVVFDPRSMASEIVIHSEDQKIIVITYTRKMTQSELLTKADSLRSL